jgi:putative GTP pyrophosphokinase
MRQYEPRIPLLTQLASAMELHTVGLLKGTAHIDRVSFRAKDAESFARKSFALDDSGSRKYQVPLADIEDQVAGRVLVFFRRDIDVVAARLSQAFNRVEQVRKAPKGHDAFAYESEHFVFIIPPHVHPDGWDGLSQPPTTFEMQVRTLFMHAWAEPEHDISYKATVPLTVEERRKLAWAASSAWGGDAIFEQVLDSIAQRASGRSDE